MGLPPCPAFSLLFCPLSPDPLPLRGRGSPKDYFAGGFAPGTPALNRLRHLQTVPNRNPEAEPGWHRSRGGVSRAGGGLAPALPDDLAVPEFAGAACLLCRRPSLPLACFVAPYPPNPLPRWGRGDSRLFHARGFAPCIPGGEPGRHRSRGGISRAGGGLAPALPDDLAIAVPSGGRGGWGCRPALPLVCFSAPYPPTPFPSGEGGALKIISPGASPPAPRR